MKIPLTKDKKVCIAGGLIAFALVFNYCLHPLLHNIGSNYQTHSTPDALPRADDEPGAVYYGSHTAPVFVNAWIAPDCVYCRIWWQERKSGFANDIASGHLEMIFHQLPGDQRDLFVAQFLACLPDASTRRKALDVFMTGTDWQGQPIQKWPRAGLVNIQCLMDKNLLNTIRTKSKSDAKKYSLIGTPSFGVGKVISVGDLAPAFAHNGQR